MTKPKPQELNTSNLNGAESKETAPNLFMSAREHQRDDYVHLPIQSGTYLREYLPTPQAERVLRVLVACEFSGRVRDAFAKRGFDAWSCDLLPSETHGQHIQGDVLEHLNDGWDLMIAHPPCTYLAYSGMGHWNDPGRSELRESAMQFFMDCYNAPIHLVAVENPKGYPMKAFRPTDQRVEPYMFGEPERKRTYLWLRGLPLLNPTSALWQYRPPVFERTGKKRWFTDRGSSDGHYRSRTFQVIADAMADQWGRYLLKFIEKGECLTQPVQTVMEER